MRNQPFILTHILFTSLVLVLPAVLSLPAKADKSDMSCILAATTAMEIMRGRIVDGVPESRAIQKHAYGRTGNQAPWITLVTRAYQVPISVPDRTDPDNAARRFAAYAEYACWFGDL